MTDNPLAGVRERVRDAVAFPIPDGALHIACEDREQALAVEELLYEMREGTDFHVETNPVVDDDSPEIQYYAVAIRELMYNPTVGWTSSDVPSEPDVDLREQPSGGDLSRKELLAEIARRGGRIHLLVALAGDGRSFVTPTEVAEEVQAESLREAAEAFISGVDDQLESMFPERTQSRYQPTYGIVPLPGPGVAHLEETFGAQADAVTNEVA